MCGHPRHAPPGGSSPNSTSIDCEEHAGCSASDLQERRPRMVRARVGVGVRVRASTEPCAAQRVRVRAMAPHPAARR